MALRNLLRVGRLQNLLFDKTILNASRNILVENQRSFAKKAKAKASKPPEKKEYCDKTRCCPNPTCKGEEKVKKKKSRLWRLFTSDEKPSKRPPKETCRKEQDQSSDLISYDPIMRNSSWGPAYAIPKDYKVLEVEETKNEIDEEKEQAANEPLPNFSSVEERLLYLADKRLHPLHNLYRNVPKKKPMGLPERQFYKTRSGPIGADEIPVEMKIKRNILEDKISSGPSYNIHPLQALVAYVAEMRKNEKPTLEQAIPKERLNNSKKTKGVFSTFFQKK